MRARDLAPAIATVVALQGCAAGSHSGVTTSDRVPARNPTGTTTAARPSSEAAVATTSSPMSEPAAIEVRLDHYAIEPAIGNVSAGRITLTVTNRDRAPHDVVLIRTAAQPDELPTTGVRLDESSRAIEVLARTARLKPRSTGSLSATLPPGTYVLVCSVPHHYVREAMVATLTVMS